ncbi:UDP-N-acetyl-D-glucosamine 2-epimerase [Thermincola ferriacetica]|uniref:UDP-N-acetyl-D-glucosamine 2-epimerase n=1 Tax=Thermincola ferriacetica TaxID=281456 RepID=A0A0L6W409_9FIRM|nr:UDP-N-acetylglucosamine 2-epimerase [Thermincola ferriacetica]KNZ70108.1 UDP-N-acetyl-D-glucosamine 2-epimerase [Thermincola ferriacetica]
MDGKKKVCIVTGTRAEYGLFYPLMQEILSDGTLALQICVTGMHLSPEFGLTYKEIEKNGFKIDEKVEMLLSSDSEVGVAKSIGLGIIGFADTFQRLNPDLVILLGDRFETMAAAMAAFVAKIPIAHLYGGELTEGAIDDAIRHSITKMSILHFVSTEEYRRRVIQLGEEPGRVFTVGALGIDNIRTLKLIDRNELEKEINFKLGRRSVLVTFHPVTLEHHSAAEQFLELLKALDYFSDLKIIFTRPNADPDGRVINRLIDGYVGSHPGKAIALTSMGQLKYLSAIRHVDAVVGNSSSGIIEVPSFGKPTVNIGDRQRGRVKAESVIDCEPQAEKIIEAMEKAFSPEFATFSRKVRNPYGEGNSAARIVKILKDSLESVNGLKKKFYDIDFVL